MLLLQDALTSAVRSASCLASQSQTFLIQEGPQGRGTEAPLYPSLADTAFRIRCQSTALSAKLPERGKKKPARA